MGGVSDKNIIDLTDINDSFKENNSDSRISFKSFPDDINASKLIN